MAPVLDELLDSSDVHGSLVEPGPGDGGQALSVQAQPLIWRLMLKQLQSRIQTAAERPQSATVQVVLGLIFVGVQFALALGGFWLLFGLFSAGLIGMPTLALTNPRVWRGVGSAIVDAEFDPRRVRRSWTLIAACSFTVTTALSIAVALTH
jgi:hypothetical protein